MHSLPIFLRLKDEPVIVVGDGEAAAAKRRLLRRAGAEIVGEEREARLAIVAVEDGDRAEAAVVRLRRRGILVNATDRPQLCDFTMPAIVDRDPVLIAIGTGGASAGLAKALRIVLERLLPARLGSLAAALASARDRMTAQWPDAIDRRHAIDQALAPGGALDPLADPTPDAVERWLETPAGARSGELHVVTLRSADPDDLSLRDARMLGRADRVFHEGTVPATILDRARADAVRVMHDEDGPPAAAEGVSIWIKGNRA